MIKMVVVDDEANIRMGIIRSHDWKAEGIDMIFEAENGLKAIEILELHGAQIIITDIKMPKMDGLELSKHIMQNYSGKKIIIISGYDDFAFAQEAVRLGAMEYLLKPARPEPIAASVRRAIEQIKFESSRKEKEAALREQLRESLPLLRDKFMNRLVTGKITNKDEIKHNLTTLEISLDLSVETAVVIFEIDDYAQVDQNCCISDNELIKFAVGNIINEIMLSSRKGIVFENDSSQIVVALNHESDRSRYEKGLEIISLADSCRDHVEQYLSITLTAGISQLRKGTDEICRAYQEALSAVSHKFLTGKNQTIHINDICVEEHKNWSYPHEMEDQLINAVFTGDSKQVDERIKHFFAALSGDRELKPDYFKDLCFGLVFILKRKLMEEKMELLDSLRLNEKQFIDSLDKQETFEGIYGYIKGLLVSWTDIIADSRTMRNRAVIIQAKKYIKEHISEDITLNTIAESVHMSPNYFTFLFKQEEGEKFSEYVAKIKLEKAKQLLMDKDIKAYEVSEKVGYQNPKYFTQFFKRHTGLTPSEFKEKSTEKLKNR